MFSQKDGECVWELRKKKKKSTNAEVRTAVMGMSPETE